MPFFWLDSPRPQQDPHWRLGGGNAKGFPREGGRGEGMWGGAQRFGSVPRYHLI